jgi:hypothetical protein
VPEPVREVVAASATRKAIRVWQRLECRSLLAGDDRRSKGKGTNESPASGLLHERRVVNLRIGFIVSQNLDGDGANCCEPSFTFASAPRPFRNVIISAPARNNGP